MLLWKDIRLYKSVHPTYRFRSQVLVLRMENHEKMLYTKERLHGKTIFKPIVIPKESLEKMVTYQSNCGSLMSVIHGDLNLITLLKVSACQKSQRSSVLSLTLHNKLLTTYSLSLVSHSIGTFCSSVRFKRVWMWVYSKR